MIQGLYAILDTALLTPAIRLSAAEGALAGGARLLQYRDKTQDYRQRLTEAQALSRLCNDYQAHFIINDDVALAADSQATGVHLGRDDATLAQARSQLGSDAIIGVSCYNDLALAQATAAAGADYIAFGSFFDSATKPQAVHASIPLLRQARDNLTLPIVAIGGITADNAKELIEAGADAVAVIRDLFAYPDSRLRAQRYAQLFALPSTTASHKE